MVSFEPINDFVIVKALGTDMEMNGVILPGRDDQQHIKAKVVAVGPGKHVEGHPDKRHQMQVKVGDIILVNSYRCAPETLPLEIDGKYMLIPEKDIAAIVRE